MRLIIWVGCGCFPEKVNVLLRFYHRALARCFWGTLFGSATLGWVLLIFYLSSLTPGEAPAQPGMIWQTSLEAQSQANMDTNVLAHLAMYGVLAMLLQLSLWSLNPGAVHRLRWALVIVAFAGAYGAVNELHQFFIPERTASGLDALVNLAGALGAAAAVRYLALYRESIRL
jgi:VanZ family protein